MIAMFALQLKINRVSKMTPYQRFQIIFGKWFRFASTSIGYNILDDDYRFTPYTGLVVTLVCSVLLCSLYTIFAFDTETSWKGATVLSLSLQGIVKSYCILKYRNAMTFLTSFLEKIYVVNIKRPSIEIRMTMDECSTHVLGITGVLFGLYILCAIAFFSYPVLAFVIFTMNEPCLPIYIPFVDMNTKEGYIVTSIYHYLILYIASIGLGFVDGLFSNLVFNVITMSELQCNQLTKLNENLAKPKCSVSAIGGRLVNMFKMHQEMEKYIKIINKVYFSMIFTQILTTSLCTVLTAFIIMTMTWYPAYMLVTCFVFQLFLFCALGTVVEIANDRLNSAILQSNYHLLPLHFQRDFKFMIHIIQNAQCLAAGNSAKLDVSTFILIMRKIYSFIVVLRTII